MKYIITEEKLKKFLKREFGVDLTGKIEMITSKNQLPYEFEWINSAAINNALNHYGPMYLINYNKMMFLVQDRGNGESFIINDEKYYISDDLFFKKIGMKPIISLMDLINQYYQEED
jgi:hypothetical protein